MTVFILPTVSRTRSSASAEVNQPVRRPGAPKALETEEPALGRQAGRERVQIHPVVALEAELHLTHGHACPKQAVSVRRGK